MQKIKLAIIGAGRMGITHYSIINSSTDITIESIVDTSSIVLNLMKKYLPVQTFKDPIKLFEKTKPDAILVCTPPKLHFRVIKMAAANNVHVFAEKPFTVKYKEAAELADTFKEQNLVNQVGYVNRFNDIFQKVKEYIDTGLLGTIIRYKSEMFSSTVTRNNDGTGWRSTRENGGGAIFEIASHAIDLVHYFFGKPEEVIGTAVNYIYSKHVEDAASTTFLHNSGIVGTLYINWSDTSYRKPTNKIEIFGTKGKILADQYSLKIYMNENNDNNGLRQGWNTIYITDVFKQVPYYVRGNEFTSQLYHFIHCIQGTEKTNKCTFKDGADTLEIIEKIFRDSDTNGRAK